VAGAGIAIPAMAGVVVDWGNPGMINGSPGDLGLIKGSAAVTNSGSTTIQTWTKTGSGALMDSSINPAYTGQGMHGVLQTGGASGLGFADDSIRNTAADTGDLSIAVADQAAGGPYLSSLIYFKAGDFLSGVSNADYLDDISVNITDLTGQSASVRFAINSGGTWYLSEKESTAVKTLTMGAPDEKFWGAFTPATAFSDFLMSAAGVTFDTLGSNLTSIEAIGYFVEIDDSGSPKRARFRVDDFQATVIPEPATLSLVTVLGGGIIFIRRRFICS